MARLCMCSVVALVVVAALAAVGPPGASGKLVLTPYPPRGFNSFDLQVYERTGRGPGWNETVFRATALAMVSQKLVEKGYDTIVIDGGWSGGSIDAYGRPVPDEGKWPSSAGGKGFAPLAAWTHAQGLKLGIWRIRGAPESAVEAKTPIKGTPYTIDQAVYPKGNCPPRWCRCTWAQHNLGLNPDHPGAQAFYDSQVELYAEAWGVDFLKWDCLYDSQAGYSREETLVVNAVRASPRPLVLSLSPGGNLTLDAARWIAAGQRASMYRVTGDFHANNGHLAGDVFVVGNMTSVLGANRTYPDLDMLDLGADSPYHGTPSAQLHATMWLMAQSPLMFAGALPTDSATLNLIANPLGLAIHAQSGGLRVAYHGDCSCQPDPSNYRHCTPLNRPGAAPCIATWWSFLPTAACRALAFLNVGNSSGAGAVSLAALGLDPATPYSAHNVFSGSAAPHTGRLTQAVPPQGAELLVLSPGPAGSPSACFPPSGPGGYPVEASGRHAVEFGAAANN